MNKSHLAQYAVKSEFVQANGLKFHVGVAGVGPGLLFLSGTNSDLRRENTPLTSPLIDHFTVLAFDQRGMGQSDKPDQPYTMQHYAEDAAAILDVMGWSSAKVVGYSFGGMVAQELAIGWPTQVSRLVLVATTAGGAGGSSYPLHQLEALEPEERARKAIEIADLSFTKEWQAANPEDATLRIKQKMIAQHQYADEPGAAAGAARQLAARAEHNTFDRLMKISQPTLVLGGDRDGQAPLAAQHAMAKRIPDCQFETLEGSHGMLWENSATFAKIADFLKD